MRLTQLPSFSNVINKAEEEKNITGTGSACVAGASWSVGLCSCVVVVGMQRLGCQQ